MIAGIAIFTLLLAAQAKAETLYVTPISETPCTTIVSAESSPCFTLSEYATMSKSLFPSNMSLVLLPGTHSLNNKFSITATHVSITALYASSSSNTNNDTMIDCLEFGSFEFSSNGNVEINGLVLHGCSNTSFTLVDTVRIENCTLLGLPTPSASALVLRSVQDVQIVSTSICLYNVYVPKNSSVYDNLYPQSGSIYISNCTALIFNTVFSGNTALENGAAINIQDSSTVVISNSEFKNQYSNMKGGAISAQSSNIEIDNCSFENNSANSGGALYLDGRGAGKVSNSRFSNNNGVSVGALFTLFYNSLMIENCSFTNNVAQGTGGALHILSTALRVYNCTFTENKAQAAGAISFAGSNSIIGRNNTFLIEDTIISNNSALIAGALELITVTFISTGFLDIQSNTANASVVYAANSSVAFLGSTTISNNFGSIYFFSGILMFDGQTTIMSNSPINNRNETLFSIEGGALTTHQSVVYLAGNVNIMKNSARNSGGAILTSESTYYLEGNVKISENSAPFGGAIFAFQCVFNFENSTIIRNNIANEDGGGVFAVGTTLRLTRGSLRFIDNSATHGGGLYIALNAKLYVIKDQKECLEMYECDNTNPETWLRIEFTDNSAEYGGAIFVNDDANTGTCSMTLVNVATECFVQTLAVYNNRYSGSNLVNIYFSNNFASVAGSSLFGGLLDRCAVSLFAEIQEGSSVTSINLALSATLYFTQITNSSRTDVSSLPVSVCACTDNQPVCEVDGIISAISVKRGQRTSVSLVAVDQFNTVVPATLVSSLFSGEGRLGEGQFSQNTTGHGKCTNLEYTIFSPKESELLSIYAEGPCNSFGISQRFVKVTFEPCECPIGFEVTQNETSCICGCDSRLAPFITDPNCIADNMIVIRQGQFWLANDNLGGFTIYSICPFDYCKNSSTRVAINLNLTDGSDAQCAFNRSGILCGACSGNLSVSFGTSRCMECPNNWLALIILFAMAGLLLVIIILVFNLTVAVGSINGLIFYANILSVNRAATLSFEEPNFSTVFIAWLNLDFGFETCFYDGMDIYERTWLGFVFPAYIIFLVVMIIIISTYSQRFSRLLSRKNPVATLATLVLLSYASVLRNVIAIFSFATIKYSDDSSRFVWLVDANVPYLKGKHIIIFIAALLVILIGLSYTVLLFTWQWLLRCPRKRTLRWITSTKLYSFMDTYHAPYNPKYRYWTGLLLLVRVVLYSILVPNVASDPSIGLLAVVCICCGLLILKDIQGERIHRKYFLSIIENSFLFNAILFSVSTYHVRFSTAKDRLSQATLANVSVSIAFITFLLIVLYHMFTFVLPRSWTEKLKFQFSRIINWKKKKSRTTSQTLNTISGKSARFSELREELIEITNIPIADSHHYQQQLGSEVPPKLQGVTHTVIDGIPSTKDE